MTVSPRAAHPSQLRNSLIAVRSWLLLTLLVLCGGFASAQGLSPGGPVSFGPVQIGNTSGTTTLTFSAPPAGVTIQSVTAVTGGALSKDFAVVSNTCSGYLHSPSTCVIELSFSPTQLGIRLGALNVRDSNGNITNTVYLSGVGVGPQFVFAPTAAVITSSSSALSPADFRPGASVVDGDDNLYFTDVTNGRILERSSLGVYSQIATLPVSAISGIAIDGTGTLYVSVGSAVYYFMPGSTPQILPLPASITPGTLAGLAIDLAQDLYIADNTKNLIYQIALGGSTGTTLAITGPGVPLSGPAGLAVDASNNLYVADSGHDRIVEIPLGSLASKVVTLTSLTLSNPTGVSVDAAGTIYIANTGGSNIIEATVTGTQFILTETPNPFTLITPANVLIQPNGDLVISDTTQGLVDVARSAPAVNFPTPTVVGKLDATDDPEHLTVQSSGNITAYLALSPSTTNPSISGTNSTAFLLATTGSCSILAAGASVTPSDAFSPGEVCTYNINFQPTVVGLNKANLILSTTAAGGALTASTTVPLTGIGLSTVDHFTLVAISSPPTTPTTINLGGSVELVLTAIRSDGSVATDYTGNVVFTISSPSSGDYLGGSAPGTNTSTYIMTAADNGVLTIPVGSGLQLNQYGVFQAIATADAATLATTATNVATSNNIFVIEPTTLTLTSSINPSLVNQTTTFTLNVATSGGLAPAGTVTFYSNGVQIGSPVTLTGGTASIPDSFPAAGNYAITATFTPSNSTQGGTASLTQVVGLPTSIVLTSSINPSLVNQSTNFTATITAIVAPTGSVTFYNGATALGTVPVTVTGNTGTATLPASFSTAGTYPITAVYTTSSTNPDVTSATSAILDQVVENTSTLLFTSSVNPSQVGQSTTLTANLTALGSPTGTVKFYDGATLLGTVNLTGGVASFSVSFATAGAHPLKAVYSGDTLTQPATATLTQNVLNVASSFTLTSSVNPSQVGQATTLTATLTVLGTPTGTVTFYDGTTVIGTANLTGTSASISVSFATAGAHSLKAVYSGDTVTQPATATLTQNVLNVVSGFTFTSSVNPSQINQSTTLTANLTALGTPTGTVSFYDGATLLGTVNLTGGVATLTVSFSVPGGHPLKAVYSGDPLTATATATLLQTVLYPTGLTLTSSVNPSLVGQSTTLTAFLNSPGTPTGTVKFYDGATVIGTATLAGSSANVSVSFATAGTHTLTAVYSGDPNNQGVTSAPLAQFVLNVAALTLTSSVNPSQPGQSTTLTATLTALGTPSGTVKFYNGATLIGTVNLTGATASISISFPTPGTYALKAVCSGDTLTGPATATLSQVVLNFSTINLTSSVNPSLVGQSTTLTASLSASGSPTGTMKFYDGATLIGTANLNGTAASISVSFATAGTHPLTAVYSGDVNTTPGTSAVLSQVVLNVTSLTLTSSVNPSQPNQPTTLTANITSIGTPTGTVSFYDGTTLIGTVTLTGPTASISVSFSTPGTHPLKAVYSGDANTSPGTSSILDQIVVFPTTITLTTSVNPVLVNANTTVTSTVQSAGTPTGTVAFYAGTTKIGTATLTGGVASLVVSFPTAGIYALTAVYSGDAGNQTATSAPVSQTVLNVVTVALTSSVNPVFLDNPTLLTALLTSTGATPTGTVSFFDGSTPLGTVALVNGSASLNATFVYAGPHTITATYSGDTVSAPANAPALAQIVADFSLTVASGSSSSGTTIAGGTANYSLVLTPLITSTLPGAVSITVTGLPTTATFTLTPSTVASGSGTTPVAFTVTAAQITAAIRAQQPPAHRSLSRYAPIAFALLALPLAWFRRRKRFGSLLASVCLLFAITAGLTGCISDPSSGYYGQTPQTYNITVTATSGNLARSTPLTLTVQ
jgi:sugar lactone lactonase YvrE